MMAAILLSLPIHTRGTCMRTWVQFFAMLYGLGLVGLAIRGVFLPPPWFFLLGAVVFVVPLGYLLTWIGDLLARHPGLEIDLVANSGFLNPSRRETDVAVLLARPRRGPLIVRKLTDYTLHLYAASTYLEQHDAIGDPTALDQHPLIGYISDILYAPELRYLEELPIAASPRLRSTSINAQHQMVASGNGLGILPRFIGSNDPTLVNILPELSIRRSFWLVTHRETHSFPPVTAFRNWLVSLVSEKRELLCAKGQ